MSEYDEAAIQALSVAGAFCGECGFEPGDRGCPDCERSWGWYVKALREAGWAPRAEVIADRDAQIIAWLEKKAREEGTSNKERRDRANAIGRMADKLSRGAVRPPLSKGPDMSAEDTLTAIRTAAQADDMPQVRRLVADHYAAQRGAEDSVEVSS